MEKRRGRLFRRNGAFTRAFSMFVSMTMVLNLVPAQGIAWAKDELLAGAGGDGELAVFEEASQESDTRSGASIEPGSSEDAGLSEDTEFEEEHGSIRIFVEVSGVDEDADNVAYNVTITVPD